MITVTQVMNLVDKWVAGGVKMRVFTDKWPDCSCAVFFYQEWFPQDSNNLKPGVHTCNFLKEHSRSFTCELTVYDCMTIIYNFTQPCIPTCIA